MMKSNYGPTGEVVRLRWRNGVYVPEHTQSSLDRVAAEANTDDLFLAMLDKVTAQGRHVSPNKSGIWAPSLFAKLPDANGHRRPAFERAMERLLNANKICVVTVGPPSKQRQQLVRSDLV